MFVTGGLGPTSDDFTRDVISQWTGSELIWDEASWQHLNDRLKPRNIPVKEIQKQQCYFPKGSQILTNKMGTANGFYLQHKGKDVFVLPGPPREIEAIWEDWIHPILQKKCAGIERLFTKSWDTIGFGESQIAELAEAALQGCDYERAYRVHIPYVEFKLSYWSSQETEAQAWCEKMDRALGSMTLLKNGEDIAETLAKNLEAYPEISVLDQTNGSFLLKRIFPFSKNILSRNKLILSNNKSVDSSLKLELICDGFETATAAWTHLGVTETHVIKSPGYSPTLQQERAHQYFAEVAMVYFTQKLRLLPKI